MTLITRGISFQSTLPAWGATIEGRIQAAAESGFNPRSPRGERPTIAVGVTARSLFQSTLPAWGATPAPPVVPLTCESFNPRSPRGGSDSN